MNVSQTYAMDSSSLNFELSFDTQRLLLQPLREWHADLLFDVLQDQKIYEFISEQAPASIEQLKARYKILSTRKSPDGNQVWLNWAIKIVITAKYIGYVQATIYGDKSASIAYVISPEFWDQGYGFEACEMLLTILSSQYKVSKIQADVDGRNTRSRKLLNKLGFKIVQRPSPQDFRYQIIL